jgi:hypothetical protein
MRSILLSFFSVFALIVVTIEGKLRVTSEWSGGFYGTIDIPVTRNVTDDEWQITVRFDQPVTLDVIHY